MLLWGEGRLRRLHGRTRTWEQVYHEHLFCSSVDAPVFSPSDGDYWTLAKWIVQATDYAHGQMVEHLLKVGRQSYFLSCKRSSFLCFPRKYSCPKIELKTPCLHATVTRKIQILSSCVIYIVVYSFSGSSSNGAFLCSFVSSPFL